MPQHRRRALDAEAAHAVHQRPQPVGVRALRTYGAAQRAEHGGGVLGAAAAREHLGGHAPQPRG
ncbi:hypothetical protein AN218_10690, partial [Streptomyces nanshensis]